MIRKSLIINELRRTILLEFVLKWLYCIVSEEIGAAEPRGPPPAERAVPAAQATLDGRENSAGAGGGELRGLVPPACEVSLHQRW